MDTSNGLEPYQKDKGFKQLIKYFLQGLFYLMPIAITIYIVVQSILLIDNLIPIDIPGLGLLIILGFITLVGYLFSTYLSALLRPFERAIMRTPLIKLIYTSIKDLMNAFVGSKKQFSRPVLVMIQKDPLIERMGFVTKDDVSDLGLSDEKVVVYLPFSYAVSGEVVIVPKTAVTPLNAKSADIMKLIISGGVTSVENSENHENT
ncbi:DUF502 domain-containing protein [Acidiluteibacter ferrifornacis]|uniref:DUF502 domain-containing protein n=1 Tax=Acidiluteibacter ferrifornacis TaxID=2692424 RepID=A0A6N9NEG0_9FLAO|nr:DUF502 domain-containing protein [Acidiluteibacter ferrifornacis]MBR9830985.1 DUF502 domain-containing protein [bacterium]NBG65008.1 DUF502 domain-containing protein [Acidiluteibacter ferrifornacis]